ncbi:MAG: ribonuclease HII [Anaerolineae bacterium]|nr:MAG: ribonuclease HII [Anaerolineae bacterium]
MARAKFDRALIPPAPTLHFEQALWAAGLPRLAGVDEAGRGALAGPVAAAAVILPPDPNLIHTLHGVRDSKEMPAKARTRWAEAIRNTATAWGVGFAEAEEIDDLGIVPATRLAAMRAIAQLRPAPQHLLIDALSLPATGLPETSLIKGDARCLSIACASVMAKTARDAHMRTLDARHPGYGWAANKGYGTAAHRRAILALGYTVAHRRTFTLKPPEAEEI